MNILGDKVFLSQPQGGEVLLDFFGCYSSISVTKVSEDVEGRFTAKTMMANSHKVYIGL